MNYTQTLFGTLSTVSLTRQFSPLVALWTMRFEAKHSFAFCSSITAHGSLAGLPEVCEIVHMIVLHKSLTFIVKKLAAWYLEHYRAYDVAISTAGKLRLVEAHELRDQYPLAHCMVDGRCLISLISLKRSIWMRIILKPDDIRKLFCHMEFQKQ
ncbi:hypothetical protein QTP70_019474 [Hemibagrus guttatus]|uniref:Uncharacterized protein n=1 Tax=Hemibagrus guttatus TaxID=175788 RepID=A0AAE0UHA1_9TELE|nr:hypothetical protein QTP70_019474 [Hemibagrus guttatus]